MSEQAGTYTSIPWIANDEKRAKYEAKDSRVAYGAHHVEGIFSAHRTRDKFDKSKGKYNVITLTTDDGFDVDVHCQGAALHNQVLEAKPKFGERIRVDYLGLKDTPNYPQPYENYRLKVFREPGGEVNWVGEGSQVDEPVHVRYEQPAAPAVVPTPEAAPAPAATADIDDIPFD